MSSIYLDCYRRVLHNSLNNSLRGLRLFNPITTEHTENCYMMPLRYIFLWFVITFQIINSDIVAILSCSQNVVQLRDLYTYMVNHQYFRRSVDSLCKVKMFSLGRIPSSKLACYRRSRCDPMQRTWFKL